MLNELFKLLSGKLPLMLEDQSLWQSLIVNRRYPHTYRVFHNLPDGNRICLHRFDPFSAGESFYHPHPWPGAFVVLGGKYHMKVGMAPDRTSPPREVLEEVLTTGAAYSITDPLTFHSVTPLDTTYTVMLNGPVCPADVAHVETRTTKGKDLDKMSDEELQRHLRVFRELLSDYLWRGFCASLSR
jgi:hypothetical protein